MTDRTTSAFSRRAGQLRGLERYINILRLFDRNRSYWSINDMSEALSVPPSTVYRTVQDMTAAYFLEPAGESQYRLGAAFIELDHLIRTTDPLYTIGAPLLEEIAEQARVGCTAILARLYNDTVMCVAQHGGTTGELVQTSYQRGVPRPLTRGATSKVIVAQLAKKRAEKLLKEVCSEDEAASLLDEFKAIRRQGFVITRGEVDSGMVGIAAPITVPERSLVASLSLVARQEDLDAAVERRLTLIVQSAASLLSQQLNG